MQILRCFILATMICFAWIAGASAQVITLDAASARGDDVPTWLHSIADEEPETQKTLLYWNSSAEPKGGPPGWDEPLASDRPDFTEASCTVGQGVRQLEMGYTYYHNDNGVDQFNAHSFPEALLRVGAFAEWLEFRVAWNYASETLTSGGISSTLSGSEDLYLGLKLGLTPQQGILPEMAIMPQMTVPLGSPLSFDRVLPGVNWLYGWEINDFLSTAGSSQLNLAVDPFTDELYTEFAQSWTIGYTLTEKLSAYTEWFVFVPAGADTAATEHYFDGGFVYSYTNNIQFDVRLGKGVSADSIDFFAGTGLVVRF
jgi:hypothetical protein